MHPADRRSSNPCQQWIPRAAAPGLPRQEWIPRVAAAPGQPRYDPSHHRRYAAPHRADPASLPPTLENKFVPHFVTKIPRRQQWVPCCAVAPRLLRQQWIPRGAATPGQLGDDTSHHRRYVAPHTNVSESKEDHVSDSSIEGSSAVESGFGGLSSAGQDAGTGKGTNA